MDGLGTENFKERKIMAEPTTDKKRTRAKRRNYQAELADLRQYCEISIEVLKEGTGPTTDIEKGKLVALENVLKRIGAKA